MTTEENLVIRAKAIISRCTPEEIRAIADFMEKQANTQREQAIARLLAEPDDDVE